MAKLRPSAENVVVLFKEYRLIHPGPSDPAKFLRWAVDKNKWDTPSLREFLDEWWEPQTVAFIGDILRNETFIHNGHEVRKWIPRRETVIEGGKKKQKGLWDDIDTAPIAFLREALSQRHSQLVADGRSYLHDVAYINEKRIPKGGRKIKPDLDLRFLEDEGDPPSKTA